MPKGTIAVVLEADVLDEAYSMGYERFESTDTIEADQPHEFMSHFKSSSEWINGIHPSLRALSGYVDSGKGTYTVPRDVIVVPQGDEDDIPLSGMMYDMDHVHGVVLEAWSEGAFDALYEDRERGDSADEVYIT